MTEPRDARRPRSRATESGDPRQAAHRPGDRRGRGSRPPAAAAPAGAGRGRSARPPAPATAPPDETAAAARRAHRGPAAGQAEYANYRRRVDRDRAGRRARPPSASVLDRAAAGARRHRPGPRARRADRRLQVGRRGARGDGRASSACEPFGEAASPFDPTLHEALMHAHSRRRHRADLRGGAAAGLPARRPACSGRRGSRWPSPSRRGSRAGRAADRADRRRRARR